jgi:hypothetical protein
MRVGQKNIAHPAVLRSGGAFYQQLFDFTFFVHNVLAGYGIEFFDFNFFRLGFLVFGGGVEVSVAFAGNKFDFIAHV